MDGWMDRDGKNSPPRGRGGEVKQIYVYIVCERDLSDPIRVVL